MSDAAKPGTGAARADRGDRRPDGSAVRVMVVDDEPSLAELMARVLRYVVELYISYLRKKIDAVGEPLIHTVRGVGYVLKPATR